MFKEHNIKHIDIDVTDWCNLQCSYCYHGPCDVYDLERPVIDKLKEILSKERMSVAFFGGEPLGRFGIIKELVSGANLRQWSITTNLTLLDQEKADFIKSNNGGVHCSIDGCRKSQDLNRHFPGGGGTFDLLKDKIPLARSISPRDTVRMTVVPNNVHLVYEGVQELHKFGFNSFAPMPAPEYDWKEQNWRDYEKCIKLLMEWNIANPTVHIKNFSDCLRGYFGARVRTKSCGAGWNTVAIATNGNITPCHRFSKRDEIKFSFGNILEGGINNEKIKEWQSQAQGLGPDCKTCECLFSCNGCCYFNNYHATGVLSNPPKNHCIFMKMTMPYARQLWVEIYNVNPNAYRPNKR